MIVNVKMTEVEIRAAISAYVYDRSGVRVEAKDVNVEVKSKQNYRSEWEQADIRCDFQAIT